jgi:hypothetical protein
VHRLRAEHALGRPLKAPEMVHHADGTVDRDAPLVICPDQAYHMLLHRRMLVVQHGGNPDTERYCRKCNLCRPFVEFRVDIEQDGERWVCRVCQTKRNKALWLDRV